MVGRPLWKTAITKINVSQSAGSVPVNSNRYTVRPIWRSVCYVLQCHLCYLTWKLNVRDRCAKCVRYSCSLSSNACSPQCCIVQLIHFRKTKRQRRISRSLKEYMSLFLINQKWQCSVALFDTKSIVTNLWGDGTTNQQMVAMRFKTVPTTGLINDTLSLVVLKQFYRTYRQ